MLTSQATAEEAIGQTEARRPPFNAVSYSGSGWLYLYEIGVSAALRDTGIITYTADSPAPITKCIGASGGALVAIATAIDLDNNLMKRIALRGYDDMMKEQGMWGCVTEVSPMVRKVLTELEPDIVAAADAMAVRRGRTSVPAADKSNQKQQSEALPRWLAQGLNGHVGVWISTASRTWPFVSSVERRRFASYRDLVEGLVASSLDAGWPQPLLRSSAQARMDTEDGWPAFGFDAANVPSGPDDFAPGPSVFDGGFTRLQPLQFAPNRSGIIFVSPLWWQFGAHIRPSYLPSLWAVAPPSDRRQYEAVYAFGYRDGVRFAAANGCISGDVAESLVMSHAHCSDPELMALQPSFFAHGAKTAAAGLLGLAALRWGWKRMMRRR